LHHCGLGFRVTLSGIGFTCMIPKNEEEFGTHQVDYVLSVPGTRDRWLAVCFSALGGGSPDDRVAALLTSLFDAMRTTFCWEQEVQVEPA